MNKRIFFLPPLLILIFSSADVRSMPQPPPATNPLSASPDNPLGASDSLEPAKLQREIRPSQLPGANCAEKIASALKLLNGNPGLLDIDTACGLGTATSPWPSVTLPPHVAMRFVEPGVYWISGITMMTSTNLFGLPVGMAADTASLVSLKQGNGINAPSLITVLGNFVSIADLAIDGNFSAAQPNNPSAGPNIVINAAHRVEIHRVTTSNSRSHGLALMKSASPKIFMLMAEDNAGDGLFCSEGGDGFVSNSEFEANRKNGVELNTCPAWRIEHSDFGLNGSGHQGGDAFLAYALNASRPGEIIGGFQILVGNQFGNNFNHDVRILGYDTTGRGGNTCTGSVMSANSFIGSEYRSKPNLFSEIALVDGGLNVVTGNFFQPSLPAHIEKSAIAITETPENGSGRALGQNQVIPNVLRGPDGAWGTMAYLDLTSKRDSGLSARNLLVGMSGPILSGFSSGGTPPSLETNNGTAAFTINVGTGTMSSQGVIHLPTAAHGWNCYVTDITSPGANNPKQSASSADSATLTNYNLSGTPSPWSAGDILTVSCFAR
jgi:hypothetical protein